GRRPCGQGRDSTRGPPSRRGPLSLGQADPRTRESLKASPPPRCSASGSGTSSGNREVGLPQVLQVQQPVRRAGVDDPAFLHDVSEIRDPKGLIRILLDEEESEAALPQLAD